MKDFIFPGELPQSIRQSKALQAEVKVYDLLKSQISDKNLNLYVFYDNSITSPKDFWKEKERRNGHFLDRQSDFIVINPDYGIINFEIKGGYVFCEGGSWKGKTKNGTLYEYDRSPIKQSSDNKWILEKLVYSKLKDIDKKISKSNYPLNFMHALSMPETPEDSSIYEMADADKSFIYFKEDNNHLAERLNFLIEQKYINSREGEYFRPGKEILSILKKLFIGEFNSGLDRSFLIKQIIDKYKDLEERLDEKIEETDGNPNFYILGGAGSGKTYMAIKKCHYELSKGSKDILFLSENPNLVASQFFRNKREYPNENRIKFFTPFGLNNYLSKDKNFCIDNFYGDPTVFGSYLNDYEIKNSENHWMEITSKKIDELYEKGKIEDFLFDAIIVDEAQDLNREYLEMLKLLLRDSSKGLFCFADNNQKLNPQKMSSGFYENIFKNLLVKNYRNTIEIFNFSKSFYEGTTTECLGSDGMKTKFILADSADDIKEKLIKELDTLKEKNISNIAVLQGSEGNQNWIEVDRQGLFLVDSDYPAPFDFKKSFSKLHKIKERNPIKFQEDSFKLIKGYWDKLIEGFPLQNFSIGSHKVLPAFHSDSELGEKNIIYDYISSFKGLERDVIILINLDDAMDKIEELYVGITRARADLIVISGKDSISRLETFA